MNSSFRTFRPSKPSVSFDPKKLGKIVLAAIIAILVLILISTCWYTVDEKQQAVITTFGKVTGTAGAGMHFKVNLCIEHT